VSGGFSADGKSTIVLTTVSFSLLSALKTR